MAHQHLLQPFGCMEDSSVFVYGLPFPDSTVWEGLYIDEHVIITMILDAGERPGLDRRIVDASHRAYAFAKLPVSRDKSFGLSRPDSTHDDFDCTAWGSEVLGRAWFSMESMSPSVSSPISSQWQYKSAQGQFSISIF